MNVRRCFKKFQRRLVLMLNIMSMNRLCTALNWILCLTPISTAA